MKRTLIIGTMMILTMTGCSKEVQAETVISTNVAIVETSAPINMEVAQTVSPEVIAQASEAVVELESLEADGRIIYDDNNGDILAVLNVEETEMHNGMQDALRRDVKKGDIAESEIAEYVKIICEDFLDEGQQKEFTSELIALIPKAKPASKTAETKATTTKNNNNNKPAETKSQTANNNNKPAPTQAPAPEVLPDPQVSDNSEYTGKRVYGNVTVEEVKISENPTYTQRELDEMNSITFN